MSVAVSPFTGLRCLPNVVAVATYPAGATFGPRTLRDYEFVWILDGYVVWHQGGRDHPAPPGSLILARPGMTDGFTWDSRRPTRHGFVHFTVGRRGRGLPAEAAWPVLRHLAGSDVLPHLFRHLAWLQAHRPPAWEALAEATLAQALVAFVTGASGTVGEDDPGAAPLVDRAFAEVHRRWGDGPRHAIPVEALARAVGVSRGHLIRVFRLALGVGPAEAIRMVRLDRGASLLGRTNLRIQDIAAAAGFDDPFHFSKAFHQAYGYAPRAFRQRCADGLAMPTLPLVQVRRYADVKPG